MAYMYTLLFLLVTYKKEIDIWNSEVGLGK